MTDLDAASQFFDFSEDVVVKKKEIASKTESPSSDGVKRKKVSFSQYSMYLKCPQSWKLAYLDGLKTYQDSIHTVFGTAIHEVVQHYIELLYTDGQGAPVADAYPIKEEFKIKFDALIAEGKFGDKMPTSEEIAEFTQDGYVILEWLTRPMNRMKYFPSRMYKIVGVELPLEINLKNNLQYIGYLDIVLQDRTSGMIKIIDLKTSSRGWYDYAKKDRAKTDQLLLYKKFYSDKFNVSLDNIQIEFIILKRKLMEDNGFAQSRINTFEPANGKSSIKKTYESFEGFLEAGFVSTGEYNTKHEFERTDNKNACKYCDFHKKQCPGYLKKNESKL